MQNKERALSKLRHLLYQMRFDEEMGKQSSSRKAQVGSMNRNEKIRTYNYTRNMITDHRIGMSLTVPNLTDFFNGKMGYDVIGKFSAALAETEKREKCIRLMTAEP